MVHINIDIDDRACTEVMRRYQLTNRQEAINFALRNMAAEALSQAEARNLRGVGWKGDLGDMRSSPPP